MKIFSLEFLCFPGLDVNCKLCEEPIKNREEEVIVPVLYLSKTYIGPVCGTCYKDLRVRNDNETALTDAPGCDNSRQARVRYRVDG